MGGSDVVAMSGACLAVMAAAAWLRGLSPRSGIDVLPRGWPIVGGTISRFDPWLTVGGIGVALDRFLMRPTLLPSLRRSLGLGGTVENHMAIGLAAALTTPQHERV